MRDPVAMVRDGKDLGGSALITERREGFRYFFANKENREEFKQNPGRYEIQLGGACGKMGPLSGTGNTGIYAVVAGRLYVFSSLGCRETFRTGYQKMLERDIVPPRATQSTLEEGRRLAEDMLRWAGGNHIDSLGPVMSVHEYDYPTASHTYIVTMRRAFILPDRFATSDKWDEAVYGYVIGGLDVFTNGGKFERPMAVAHRRSADRVRNTNYLRALFAATQPSSVLIGRNGMLEVYFDNCLVSFELSANGRVLAMRTLRRNGTEIGESREVFTGFTDYKGVKLPTGWNSEFEGEPGKSVAEMKWMPADMALFSPTK
jgi:YHS domain-containing protein